MNESLMELKIGQERQILPHEHAFMEFFYVIEGKMQCTSANQTFAVFKDDFFVVQKNQSHTFTASEKVLYMTIHVNHAIAGMYSEPELICCTAQMSRKETSENQKTRRLLRKIMNLYLSEDKMDELLLQSAYYELFYHLAYFYTEKDTALCSEEQRRRNRILKFIEENYFYPVKLQDLAQAMHFSTVYMSRYFKKLFGVNFLDYLNQFRLKRAKDMLVQNMSQSVAQIAMDCGFPNLTAFYKSFNQVMGTSPSKYRNEMKYMVHQSHSSLQNAKTSLRKYLKLDVTKDEEADGYVPVVCSAAGKSQKYNKCWSKVINVGAIALLARSDFQKHVLFLKKELGFLYTRLWNIDAPDLQMIKYQEHQLTFDFSRLDRIFDFLIENGLHIYLDLGNKPARILRGTNNILTEERYPKLLVQNSDYQNFILHFIDHFSRRYGKDEVNQWYFECWYDYEAPAKNAKKQYEDWFCMLYDVIKKYAPKAKIGGIGDMAEPLYQMPEVLRRLDFISIYSYPNDYPQKAAKALDIPEGQCFSRDDYLEYQCGQLNKMQNHIRLSHIRKESGENVERHISEWGFSVSNRNMLNDSIFKAAYIVKNCINIIGQADLLAYWNGTDLFAEYNDTKNILFGGTGLLTRHMLLKPSYYAFNFLNHMGSELLARTENTLITADAENDFWILCHNYKKPGPQYFHTPEEKITAQNYMDYMEDMEKRSINIRLNDLTNGRYTQKHRIINEHFGNLIGLWKEMGYPNELTFNDVNYLQKRCIPKLTTTVEHVVSHTLHLDFDMEPNEIRLIHVSRERSQP